MDREIIIYFFFFNSKVLSKIVCKVVNVFSVSVLP